MKNTYKKNQTYFNVGFTTFVLLVTTGSVLVNSEQGNGDNNISKTFTFSMPQIDQITIDNQMYDQVTMLDSPSAWNVGEPNLPTYGVSILLPSETAITTINAQPGSKISLGTGFNVIPIQQAVKFSDLSNTNVKIIKNQTIYLSETVFPTTLFSIVGTYSYRGYSILILLLYPVQYKPMSGELFYFNEMSISIGTTHSNSVNLLYRGLDTDRIEVLQKVDSFDAISSYIINPSAPLSGENYDLLILTTDELKEGFSPLKETHDAQGIKTEIKTLTDVSIFPGQVTPDTIRDFIRNEYINNGIEYVLIGGDSDIVPVKMLWVQAGQETTTMPSDLFYGCLDGTYNYNENDKWGEPRDGDGGGDVDLVAEVYIGRASVSDISETNNFVQKTISYINTGGLAPNISLMVGEYLWGPPDYPITFGDDSMEELINGSQANQYTTIGIPSVDYVIERLYDHDWPGFDLDDPWHTGWSTSDIINRINNGVSFVNHLGHSNTNYAMRMGFNDVQGLTNTVLPFIYSQGCYAGAFDEGDCIAEDFTVKTNHAAYAVIMCARYGWGVPGSTNGPSQRFHRYFWDAVYGENITAIGKANQDSKEENLKKINGQCMRWCYYQMNLFGDPSLTFFTSDNISPEKPSKPLGEVSGHIGQSYNYTTSTTDLDSDVLYYKWSFGDGTISTWLGPYNSGEQVSIIHNWSKWGNYEVKVKARDEHRAESDWSDPLPVKMPFIPKFLFWEYILKFFQRYLPLIYVILNSI